MPLVYCDKIKENVMGHSGKTGGEPGRGMIMGQAKFIFYERRV